MKTTSPHKKPSPRCGCDFGRRIRLTHVTASIVTDSRTFDSGTLEASLGNKVALHHGCGHACHWVTALLATASGRDQYQFRSRYRAEALAGLYHIDRITSSVVLRYAQEVATWNLISALCEADISP